MLLLIVSMAGCDSYSPNLGVTPAQSSQVSGLNPSAAPVGGSLPVNTLIVSGAGFVTGSVVLWNNAQLTTTFVNSGELTAIVDPSLLATAGSVSVGVASPGSNSPSLAGNNLSNFLLFTIEPANGATPTISELIPPSATVGGAAFTLEVTGTAFTADSIVLWNSQSLTTTFVTDTELTAQVPAANIASVPVIQPLVSVFNVPPGGGTSNSATFTITSGQAAVIAANRTALLGPRHRFLALVAPSDSSAGGSAISEIFVQDTCMGAAIGCLPQKTFISLPATGIVPNGNSGSPSITADGRFVAFVSDATNLVPNDTNGLAEVFLRDTCIGASSPCTPATSRISVGPNGLEANGPSSAVSISPDDRFVVFESTATNLVLDNDWGLAPSSSALFLRDTCAGAPAGCTPSTTRLVFPAQASR